SHLCYLHSFPTRRSSDLVLFATGTVNTYESSLTPYSAPWPSWRCFDESAYQSSLNGSGTGSRWARATASSTFCVASWRHESRARSEEHTSELQSRFDIVC